MCISITQSPLLCNPLGGINDNLYEETTTVFYRVVGPESATPFTDLANVELPVKLAAEHGTDDRKIVLPLPEFNDDKSLPNDNVSNYVDQWLEKPDVKEKIGVRSAMQMAQLKKSLKSQLNLLPLLRT